MSEIKNLIEFVNGLEKAYKFINDMSTFDSKILGDDINKKIKETSMSLSFIIEDIDEMFKFEFFGEEE